MTQVLHCLEMHYLRRAQLDIKHANSSKYQNEDTEIIQVALLYLKTLLLSPFFNTTLKDYLKVEVLSRSGQFMKNPTENKYVKVLMANRLDSISHFHYLPCTFEMSRCRIVICFWRKYGNIFDFGRNMIKYIISTEC